MPVRVLIVDDSPLARSMLRAVIARFPELEVVGEAGDGLAAEELVKQLAPDVVTMDVVMPIMGGLETIDRIMAERPTPILVVAHVDDDDQARAMEALDRGAIAVFPKPTAGFDAKRCSELAAAITRAAQVPMRPATPSRPHRHLAPAPRAATSRIACIGIVGSTGSPRTLRAILGALRPQAVYGIAVVQHTTRGFTHALASWLDGGTRLHVRVAQDGTRLDAGEVVIAPDDAHLVIAPGGVIRTRREPAVDGHRPSATVLLRSLAQAYGARAAGVVLSGMGRDGADGLAAIERAGGLAFVEDPELAVVGGMPREALKVARSAAVVPASALGETLARFGRTGGA